MLSVTVSFACLNSVPATCLTTVCPCWPACPLWSASVFITRPFMFLITCSWIQKKSFLNSKSKVTLLGINTVCYLCSKAAPIHCGVSFKYCSNEISSATYLAKLSATFVRHVRKRDSRPVLQRLVHADHADHEAQPALIQIFTFSEKNQN